jgi:hypothetical protein
LAHDRRPCQQTARKGTCVATAGAEIVERVEAIGDTCDRGRRQLATLKAAPEGEADPRVDVGIEDQTVEGSEEPIYGRIVTEGRDGYRRFAVPAEVANRYERCALSTD